MSPLSCPHCHRPNHENRWRCLYCGAALERAANAVFYKKVHKPGPAHFLIVLLPAESGAAYSLDLLTDEALAWVQENLGIDRFHMERLLKQKTLQILRTTNVEAEAKNMAQHLLSYGLRVEAIVNEALNALGESFTAKAMDVMGDMDKPWMFYDPEKGKVSVLPEKISMLAKGKIRVEKIAKDFKSSGKSGDRGESHAPYQMDTHDFWVMELFAMDETLPPIRLKSSRFDFHCLGSEVTHSSDLNFQKLLMAFTKRLPNLCINDHFRLLPPVLKPTTTASTTEEEFFATTDIDPNYHHNEKQFDQFARLAFYLFKKGIRL